MYISDDKILVMLRKVAVLREQLSSMCIGKQGPVLSVMDLHYVVEQVYSLKIEMLEVSFAAEYLRGKVERYSDNRARVLVRSGVREADKRLVAVKELCHLALDEKDDWSADGGATLDALIEESRSWASGGKGSETPTTPLQSEGLALMAAVELLYPSEYRNGDAEKLSGNHTTLSSIGLQHNIPPFAVEFAQEHEERLSHLRNIAESNVGLAAE